MEKDRMLAFSDGVFAVIITIMVLELKVPHGATFESLRSVAPAFFTYVVSFIYIGIYWNNHHHMLAVADETSGAILWANLHLLFWLSIIPFVSAWVGESNVSRIPTATYSFVLLMSGLAYSILQAAIISHHGPESELKKAVGKDYKGKVSVVLYAAAICTSLTLPVISVILAVLPALIWFIPDPRIEKRFGGSAN